MNPRGIIILEGADGTGKTTLARALCERYDGVYIHNRRHDKAWIWAYHLASLRWAVRAAHEGRLVVIDRHWPSECIYARVYRDGCAYGTSVRALHRAFLRFGAVYVVCAPKVQVVIDNHRKLRGERQEMYEDVSQVALRYHQLWNGTGHAIKGGDYVEELSVNGLYRHTREADLPTDRLRSWFHYDYTEYIDFPLINNYVGWLASVAHESRNACWQPGLDPYLTDVTGPVATAKVCLVGDRPAVWYSRFSWPFTGCNNSSRYLNEKLHAVGAVEEKICFLNVNGRVGSYVLKQLPQDIPLVALGQEALRGLNSYGRPPHAVIRHPQHARRFTHHGGSYERELSSVLAPYGAAHDLSLG